MSTAWVGATATPQETKRSDLRGQLLPNRLRRLDRARVVDIGDDEPAVQGQRRTTGFEHAARVRKALGAAGHPTRPQALDQGSEVPKVEEAAVDRDLLADSREPAAVQQRRQQGVLVAGLVEAGDGQGGAR